MHSKPILLRSRRLPLIVAKILPISRSWVTARAPEPEACHLAGRATVQARRMYTHPHRPTFLSRRLQVRHLRSVHRHMLHLPSTIVGDEVDQRLLLTRPLPRHSTSPHPAILQRVRDTLPHHHLSLQLRLVIAHNPHHSARHLPATRQPVRLSVPRPHAILRPPLHKYPRRRRSILRLPLLLHPHQNTRPRLRRIPRLPRRTRLLLRLTAPPPLNGHRLVLRSRMGRTAVAIPTAHHHPGIEACSDWLWLSLIFVAVSMVLLLI